MAKKYTGRVEVKRSVSTFAAIGHASTRLLIHARENPKPGNWDVMAALLFSAFTFEAALNHIGSKVVPCWEEMERLSWRSKLTIISKALDAPVDFGKKPHQTLLELFRYRDAMAHGRDEEGKYVFEVTDLEPAEALKLHPKNAEGVYSFRERHCTLDSAEAAYADSRIIVEELYRLAKLPNEPFSHIAKQSATLVDLFPDLRLKT